MIDIAEKRDGIHRNQAHVIYEASRRWSVILCGGQIASIIQIGEDLVNWRQTIRKPGVVDPCNGRIILGWVLLASDNHGVALSCGYQKQAGRPRLNYNKLAYDLRCRTQEAQIPETPSTATIVMLWSSIAAVSVYYHARCFYKSAGPCLPNCTKWLIKADIEMILNKYFFPGWMLKEGLSASLMRPDCGIGGVPRWFCGPR